MSIHSVIAAGGIMDGRGVLASIVLGAEGVQMGTAFLTSQDSNASELLRDAIINSKEKIYSRCQQKRLVESLHAVSTIGLSKKCPNTKAISQIIQYKMS